MQNYYFNGSTIFKYLRKVLNEINNVYVDSGIRSAFIMKRYCEFYKVEPKKGARLALLTLLKDIGSYYQDESIPKENLAYRAASSYTFLKNCSPLREDSKPLLFYKAKYINGFDNEDYYNGLLITLVNQVVMYDYQEYCQSEIDYLKNALSILFDDSNAKVNWQKVAAASSYLSDFSVICGGPGTGKTTTVLKLLMLLLAKDPDEHKQI